MNVESPYFVYVVAAYSVGLVFLSLVLVGTLKKYYAMKRQMKDKDETKT